MRFGEQDVIRGRILEMAGNESEEGDYT